MTEIEIKDIIITPYRISTITCNANIGDNINIDLYKLYQHIKIDNTDGNFIWIQYLKDDIDNIKGIYPKKTRKSKINCIKKNRFDNQVTVIYKFGEKYIPNIKIFKNGNIQLTGIKKLEDTEIIANEIINNIKNIYNNIDKTILLNDDIDILEKMKYSNFKIRMINSDFKIFINKEQTEKFNIRRKELHNLLISNKYNNKSSFQPGIYQGVKIDYFWNINNHLKNGICCCTIPCIGKKNIGCKKVTIAIFESGSILITGGITFEQIEDAYNYIINIIKENHKLIRRPELKFDI